jgi:pyrimidine deaminase RibD-like protein
MQIDRHQERRTPINLRVRLETIAPSDVWYRFKMKGRGYREGILRSVDGKNFSYLDGKEIVQVRYDDIEDYEVIALSSDRYFMAKAIEVSRQCKHEISDDKKPYVGAVLVTDNRLVATAYRGEVEPGQHAEFILLQKKNVEVEFGSTLYTTLEPCTRRNPPKNPCAVWINRQVNISRVVIGMLDPNQAIKGEGVWLLREAGKQVALCDHEQMLEIEELNRDFIDHYRRVG